MKDRESTIRKVSPQPAAFSLCVAMLAFCLLSAKPAYAACANPDGIKGVLLHTADLHVMQYCNGTSWIAVVPGAGASPSSQTRAVAVPTSATHIDGIAPDETEIKQLLFLFALIYVGFILGVLTDRLFLRSERRREPPDPPPKPNNPQSGNPQSGNPQSGSVFTILLAAIAMAGAVSVVLYQTMSGPLSSMVRVTNKTTARSQMQTIANIVISASANQAACSDNLGYIAPVPMTATGGAHPAGGGLLPTTIGAPLTDPWGTPYGYCAWEVGTTAGQTLCGAENLLHGTPTPVGPPASNNISGTVIAIISAGPDRQFSTSCQAYAATGGTGTETTPVVYVTGSSAPGTAGAGGDDIVLLFNYQQAANATSYLWTLSPTSNTTAVIGKEVSVGSTLGTVPAAVTAAYPTNGIINAAAVVTAGGMYPGGALGLANIATASLPACNTTDVGNMYYATTGSGGSIVVCTCTGGSCPSSGTYNWSSAGAGAGSALNALTAAVATNTIDSTTYGQIWNWTGLTGTALTLASTSTAAAAAQTVLNVSTTGANGTSALTTYGEQISNTHSGTTSTNVGLYVTASGGTTANYALITGTGNVGIGTAAPAGILDVEGGTSTTGNGTNINIYSQGALTPGGYNGGNIILMPGTNNGGTGTNGNVGIYTTTPTALLTVGSYISGGAYPGGSVLIQQYYDTGNATLAMRGSLDAQTWTVAAEGQSFAVGPNNLDFEYNGGTKVSLASSGYVGIGTKTPATMLTVAGPLSLNEPTTPACTSNAYTVAATDSSLTFADASGCTVTLPAANSFPGRILYMSNNAAGAITSTSGADVEVYPAGSTTAGTAILPATVGAWAELQSNGTDWVTMASGVGGGGAGTTLNGITAATGTASITSPGADTIVWDWSGLSAATAFTFGEITTAATGASEIVNIATMAASTAVPLTLTNAGASTIAENITAGGLAFGGVNVLAYPNNDSSSFAVGPYALSAQNSLNIDNTAVGNLALHATTSGPYNTAVGSSALHSNTTGGYNTALGVSALAANITGSDNTAMGYAALTSMTTSPNDAFGYNAGYYITTGINNVALGYEAMQGITATPLTGSANTAVGNAALVAIQGAATGNTAMGYQALFDNTSASDNTAVGYAALQANTVGPYNTAVGNGALRDNTSGWYNAALGYGALGVNTTANANTALGYEALSANTTGTDNTALGYSAGDTGATGAVNTVHGSTETFLGYQAAASVDPLTNATAIGANAVVGASNSLVLGSGANVGIRTPNPANYLSVANSTAQYSTGTAFQSTTTITGVGTTFTSGMVGGTIVYSNGVSAPITAYTSATSLTSSVSQTVSSTPGLSFNIYYPGLEVTSAGYVGIGTSVPAAPLDVEFSAPGTISSSGTTVTGVGTTFTTTFAVGSYINAGGQSLKVASITSNTSLTTTGTFSPAIAAASYYGPVGSILNAGYVSIDSSVTPPEALSVNGNIVLNYVSGAGGSAKIYSQSSNPMTISGGATSACFAAGTQVTMAGGNTENIEKIKVGEQVESYDLSLHKTVASRVTQVFRHAPEVMGPYYLVIKTKHGRRLNVTTNHPIYANGVWKEAGKLKLGDRLFGLDKQRDAIASIEKIHTRIPTYNIEVDKYHVYFADDLLVHNKIWAAYEGALNVTGGNETGAYPGGGVYVSGGTSSGGAVGNVVLGMNMPVSGSALAVSQGRVGVNTQLPANNFSVASSTAQYGFVTASQSGTTITGVGTTFTSGMVGGTISFLSGASAPITGYTNATTLTSSVSQTVSSGNSFIYYPGLEVASTGNVGIGTTLPGGVLDLERSAPGTVSSSGATVTGSSTTFTTTFAVGDTIYSSGQSETISAIGSNTSLTTAANFSPVLAASSPYARIGAILNGGNVGIGTITPATMLTVAGPLSLNEPTTPACTSNVYTVTATDSSLTFNDASGCTVTLPAANSFPGRILFISNNAAGAITSTSGADVEVYPAGSTTAGTAILPATVGAFAELQSNGTDWVTLSSGIGGGGVGSTLNGITAATGTASITSPGADTIVWDWSGLSAATAFTFGEITTAATGASKIVNIATMAASTAVPLTLTNAGASTIAENITAGGLAFGGTLVLAYPDAGVDTTSLAVGPGALAAQNAATLYNTAVGDLALHAETSAPDNTAVGYGALAGLSGAGSTASDNTAVGEAALYYSSACIGNTAVGSHAMANTGTGNYNTAVGATSLYGNSTGSNNTALGYYALYAYGNNISNSTSVGYQSLYSAAASPNDALGYNAGYYITSGTNNVALGYEAMQGISGHPLTGTDNTAVGNSALSGIMNGAGLNTAVGSSAMLYNNTGSSDTALGYKAMMNTSSGSNNTAVGQEALYGNTTGSSNVALGYAAGLNYNGSNDFFLNNIQESSLANDQAYSLLYGTFSGTAGSLAGQQLTVNGNVGIGTLAPAGQLQVGGGTGQTGWALNVTPTGGTASQTAFFQDQTPSTGRTLVVFQEGAANYWPSYPVTQWNNSSGTPYAAMTSVLGLEVGSVTSAIPGNGFGLSLTGATGSSDAVALGGTTSFTDSADDIRIAGTPGTYDFSPSSGTGAFNLLDITGWLWEQSSSFVTRGLYVNPKITPWSGYNAAAYDFRAIETAGYTQTLVGTPPTTVQQVLFNAPTYTAGSATTVTNAATEIITGAPIAGTNVTITHPAALVVESGNVGIDTQTPGGVLDLERSAPGTVSSSGATVTGSSTTFTTTFAVGDTIYSSGQSETISAIGSNTSLTTAANFSPVLAASSPYARIGEISNAGNVGVGTTTPATMLTVAGPLSLNEPTTPACTSNAYTVAATDSSLTFADASGCTVTLPAANSFPGRILYMSNNAAGAIISTSGADVEVYPAGSTTAGTAILPATVGAFAELQSNGTDWVTLSSGIGGGGAGTTLNGITAATGTNTIANGSNAQIWNWNLAATGDTAFTFGESSASTAAATLVAITAATGSDTVALAVTGQVVSKLYTLTDAATVTVNWNNGNVQYLLMTAAVGASRTINFTNGVPGGQYTLILRQSSTGSNAVTWCGSGCTIGWPGGGSNNAGNPTLTTTDNAWDYVSFVYSGIVSNAYSGVGISQNFSD